MQHSEVRAIWVRPTETTISATMATVERIRAAGFNTIFLETFYHGWTIYPSRVAVEHGIVAQRPEFAQAECDALAVWLDAAHKHDLQVHAWLELFYVWNAVLAGSVSPVGPVLQARPEWTCVERRNDAAGYPQPCLTEPGLYYLDPALPEVRQFIKLLCREILATYPVDGLQLDYIRYPTCNPPVADYSYSEAGCSAFQNDTGLHSRQLQPESAEWQIWVAWRKQRITELVGEINRIKQEVRPAAVLSVDVYANLNDAAAKMQDWQDWVSSGIIDWLVGMCFGRGAEATRNDVATMLRVAEGRLPVIAGLYSVYYELAPQAHLDQIVAAREVGAAGQATFDYARVTDNMADVLSRTVYSGTAAR